MFGHVWLLSVHISSCFPVIHSQITITSFHIPLFRSHSTAPCGDESNSYPVFPLSSFFHTSEPRTENTQQYPEPNTERPVPSTQFPFSPHYPSCPTASRTS